MSNYGTNIGKGNSFGDSTTINNTTNIRKRKSRIAISVTIGVVVIVAIIAFFILRSSGANIVGKWITDDGDVIEFLSDGTLHEGGSYDALYADTYEIVDGEYLKWGKYSAAWIEYKYTYWDIKISKNKLTLTKKDDPDDIMVLTRE